MCREAQYTTWKTKVIPALVQPYMALRFETKCGRTPSVIKSSPLLGRQHRPCSCGRRKKRIPVEVAFWDHIERVYVTYCLCHPASETLIKMGLFGCAPIEPSMAFDVNLLDLISTNMTFLAPNVGGWSITLETFWRERGYSLGQRERVRRRFSNALHWYTVLLEAVNKCVVDSIRPPVLLYSLPSVPAGASIVPATEEGDMKPIDVVDDESNCGDRGKRRHEEDQEAHPRSKRRRHSLSQASDTNHVPIPVSNQKAPPSLGAPPPMAGSSSTHVKSEQNHQPPSRPLDHLRKACPLCFGGDPKASPGNGDPNVIVCPDANFTQKCMKPKYDDPALQHPLSHFLPQEEIAEMERQVEERRNTKGKKAAAELLREMLKPLLPDDVLDECERSFIAAQEATAKASGKYYVDTGLMALVCRHDRLLWIVNLTTPGEKQFYAFALINRLFREIPSHWRVGLLYDIGCQLERSMVKHGILSEYYTRLIFAVLVFHAFGHQWVCQLLYHPRKHTAFGLSDGEGCERFWSSIRRLIPSLRISGRYRRRWVLDRQFMANKQDSFRLLGLWIRRKWKACDKKEKEAKKILDAQGIEAETVRVEWAAQVKAQTAKLTRQTKSAGDEAIDRVLELRHDRDELQQRMATLQRELETTDAALTETRAALAEDVLATRERLDALTRRMQAAERSLGVSGRTKLEKLKGNEFLRFRMNAKALKSRIRAKVISQKFERSCLERVYRHQVSRDKDHSQTKGLLKRGHQAISKLVSKFNAIVDLMKVAKRKGRAPPNIRLPVPLQTKKIFHLDIDDNIWDEDGLLEVESIDPPGWLANQAIRDAIPALLECDRVAEERTRLLMEEKALVYWLKEEKKTILDAF
ncbi:hypothetical protein M422DRAFT_213744, partial [Sphaerobolus stellatus SS14]